MTTIYSILSTLNSLESKQEEVQETREPVQAKGSIKEGIAARLEAKFQEFKESAESDKESRGINDPDRQRERKWLATDHETLDRLERRAVDKAKLAAKTMSEGEVCPKCDSEPCQCEEINEEQNEVQRVKFRGTDHDIGEERYVFAVDGNPLVFNFSSDEDNPNPDSPSFEEILAKVQRDGAVEHFRVTPAEQQAIAKKIAAERQRYLDQRQQDVAEGHADQQRKIVKKNGKPVGEIGIDRESSPGAGMYYMKHYASGLDLGGYDSREEAMDELRYAIKQGVAEDDVGEGNEFSGALAKAKAAGAEEFEVDGKTYKVKEALDTNLLKAIAKGGATMPHDPESDRNIHKKYGYRGDREEEDDDAYDEWGNLKPGRKAKPAAPGEKRGRGRPKGSKRATGAKFTGKSKLLNMSEARLIDEDGNTLKHILDRFPAEVKAFEQGEELEDNLYDALFDYYMSSGEMPYGVAKARTGDPFEWITERLVAELGLDETQEIIAQETDMDLNELSRLAGLKESCGTMSPMTQTGSAEKPEINVSTNYNSADDNKSITVTAQGDSAVALAQILKLSGLMGEVSAEKNGSAGVIVAGRPMAEEEVEEERDPEYANTPNEETAGIDAAVPSGNDLHKSKGANPNWHGDNAMRTTQFEDNDPIANLGRRLMKEYESIKVSK